MSDQIIINVTLDPAILIDAIDHQEEIALNPVTLNQGLIDHAVTHISGGSDELFHNSLRNQGGKNGEYYHLTLEQYNNIIYQTGSGSFATQGFVTGISGDLQQQISNLDSETGSYVLKSQTGAFYPSSNPSGFITGVDLTPYATTGYVTGISGALQQQVNILQGQTGSYTLHSETGAFYPSSNPSGFITGAPNLSGYATEPYVTGISGGLQQQITKLDNQTGNYTLHSETGVFYPKTNPSGFITGVDLSSYATTGYVTGASGILRGDISILQGQTGSYALHSETGVFYPRTNPSGYITGVDLSATGSFLTTGSADSLYVSLTSSQTISGAKAFDQRPTVFGTGVMLSGEAAQLPTTLVYTTGDQDISGIKTFASGIPLLNASLSDFYNNQQIVDKEYVDSRTMGGNKSWFFTKDASNVSDLYNATITFPNASGQEIASSAHNGESTIAQFLTEPQSKPYTVLDGMRFFHLTAKVSSVSKITQLRGEVWTCDATGGSQSLLRTSTLTTPLTIANAEYATSVYGGSLYIPTSTRIIFKIISVKESGGGSPTVTLSVNDNTFSRLDVPSPVGVTDTSTLLKLDQTTNPQTIIGPLSVGGNIYCSGIISGTAQNAIDFGLNGVISQEETNILFNDSTYAFSIIPTGTYWSYYRKGVKTTVSGSKTVALNPVVNKSKYYIYLDSNDGALVQSQVSWTLLDDKVPLASIYLNTGLSPKYVLFEERHPCTISIRTHYIDHLIDGTEYLAGGEVSGYAIDSTNYTGKACSIGSTAIADQNILLTLSGIPDDSTYYIMYRPSGSDWQWTGSNVPFKYNGSNGYIEYDNSTGMAAATNNNQYVNSYLFVNNAIASGDSIYNTTSPLRYMWLMGKSAYTTTGAAYAETFSSLNLSSFPVDEGVAIYQFTWHTNATSGNATTNPGRCSLLRTPARVTANLISSTIVSSTNHNTLAGLDGGSNGEYYHLTNEEYSWLKANKQPAVNHDFWPAGMAIPATTSGAAVGTVEVSTSGVVYDCYDFDSISSKSVQYIGYLPKWDAGPIKAKVSWTYTGTPVGTNVGWNIQGGIYASGDSLNRNFGTAQTTSQAKISGNYMHITTGTSYITLSGTPTGGLPVILKVTRNTSTPTNLSGDAKLLGILLEWSGSQTVETAW